MKTILILIFSILSVYLYGQGKTVQGTLEPLSTNISTNTSGLVTTNTNVNNLESSTSGVVDWTLTYDGDTVFMAFGGSTFKLLAIDAEAVDVTAPLVSSIEVGTLSDDTIVIVLNEAMDTDSIPSTGSFTFTEDGNAYGISSPLYSNSTTLKIPLDSSAEAQKEYLLDYTRPGLNDLQDVAGNKLLSFTNTEAVNNVSAASDIYAYMLFENDDDDEMGVMTFTWTGSEAYKTTGSPPQGTHSTNTPGAVYATTDQTHDLGNLWAFAGWFNSGNDINSSPRTLLTLDGAEIQFDYSDGAQYLNGTIGGQSFSSTLIGDETAEYKWTHMGVTYDGVNGYARTYINGVNVSSDSVVGTGADGDGFVIILSDGSTYHLYGDTDDIHFYKAVLTDAQTLWMYSNPGVPVGGKTDPPVPSDSVEVLFVEDWDDFSTTAAHTATAPVGIPNDSLSAHMTNFFYLGSDDANDPNKADNADIVVFDGSNAMKSWYLEGQCCTGAASQISYSNGGTGIHLESYITNSSTYYPEVYVSYNVWIESSFDNSDGFKAPGVRSATGGVEQDHSRLMIVDYSAVSGDLNPAYYTRANWTSPTWATTWGTLGTRTNAKDYDVSKGQWVNITTRHYEGTVRGENGRAELFINGVYFGEAVSSVPFRDTGDSDGWLQLSFETFMGGSSTSYNSPRDQWMIHDEVVVFRFTDGADVVKGSTPSAVGRDISGTLQNISQLNFPR